MIILQINAVCGVASTGRTTLELAEMLENKGHKCYVAYSHGNSNFQNSYKIGNLLDHKLHAIFYRITGLQGYFSNIATKKLIKYIKHINPDVIHLRNLHSNYINLNMLLDYIAKNNLATVVTLHDCWFFTGKCNFYPSLNCNRWKSGCGNCPENKRRLIDLSGLIWKDKEERFKKINNLAVVGVSDWITNEAKQSLLGTCNNIKRIYNWIDFSKFYPRNPYDLKKRLNLINKYVYLGVATEWGINKGINDVLKLSKLIQEDEVIILVGKQIMNYKFPKNVLIIEHTNNVEELSEYYSLADVFINPSIQETFGKVTAEALCCGTPVIVYNNTASPELVGNGCGFVVETNNVYEMYERLQEIRLKGKYYYSQNCLEFAKNNFDFKENSLQYLELYKSLIN